MRRWLALACVLLLISGCSYLKQGAKKAEDKLNQERTEDVVAPAWNPVYDTGPGYSMLSGKVALHDLSEFKPEPGATFFVKIHDFDLDKEGRPQPTASGVVYLEQLTVKTLKDKGYEHVGQGTAAYGLEIQLLCLDPAREGSTKALEKGLAVPETSDERFPFPWNKDYQTWTGPGQTPPGAGCTAFVLLAVHAPAKDGKTQDVYVARLAVSGCPSEEGCPVSACGFLAGRALLRHLESTF